MSSLEKSGTIEIPDNLLVGCPLVKYQLVPVANCVECPLFGGLEDRFPGSHHAFHDRYMVKCFEEPVKRKMVPLAGGKA